MTSGFNTPLTTSTNCPSLEWRTFPNNIITQRPLGCAECTSSTPTHRAHTVCSYQLILGVVPADRLDPCSWGTGEGWTNVSGLVLNPTVQFLILVLILVSICNKKKSPASTLSLEQPLRNKTQLLARLSCCTSTTPLNKTFSFLHSINVNICYKYAHYKSPS